MTTFLTAGEWAARLRDPMRYYLDTPMGPRVEYYLTARAEAGLAKRTIESYKYDLARLCVYHDGLDVVDVTTRQLEEFIALYPMGSRKRVAAAVRMFFKRMQSEHVIIVDPAAMLPAYKVESHHIIDVFDDREQDLLKHMPHELRDRALTRLLLETGIRRREALNLRMADVDLDGRKLGIRPHTSKSRRGRVIPLPASCTEVLADLALLERLGRDDYLWYTHYWSGDVTNRVHVYKRDTPLSETAFFRWWARMCDEAEVRYRNAHTTRHTYATGMLARGVDMRKVAKLLGHASISTTVDLYDHLSVGDLSDAVDRAFS